MPATTCGCKLGAALSLLISGVSSRKKKNIDVSEVALTADENINKKLRKALINGDVRLLRCSWLATPTAEKHFRDSHSTHGDAIVMQRMQDLPAEAFFSPAEAAALLDRGDRSILVLSCRWLTAAHPEPLGTTLAVMRRYLNSEPTAKGCGLFWDYASLPQKAHDGTDRTADEKGTFKRALTEMANLYASLTGSAILQLKDVPPRPEEYDGRIVLFATDEHPLASQNLRQFGEVTRLQLVGGITQARATFARHEQAELAVAMLRQKGCDVDLMYNTAAYDRDQGVRYSGWCTFEQACATLAAAHLVAAEQQAAARGSRLPRRIAVAQASRPKVIDISNGMTRTRAIEEAPGEMLAALAAAADSIEHANFTCEGDRPVVQQLLAELERAMERAARAPRHSKPEVHGHIVV